MRMCELGLCFSNVDVFHYGSCEPSSPKEYKPLVQHSCVSPFKSSALQVGWHKTQDTKLCNSITMDLQISSFAV